MLLLLPPVLGALIGSAAAVCRPVDWLRRQAGRLADLRLACLFVPTDRYESHGVQERKLQAKLKGDAAGQKADSPAAAAAAAAAGSPAGSGGGASQQEQQQADGQQQQQQQEQEPGQSQQSRQQQEEEEEASPFAAISATMGWDCFHWLTMLWILLRCACWDELVVLSRCCSTSLMPAAARSTSHPCLNQPCLSTPPPSPAPQPLVSIVPPIVPPAQPILPRRPLSLTSLNTFNLLVYFGCPSLSLRPAATWRAAASRRTTPTRTGTCR